jgi:hypothetical protein
MDMMQSTAVKTQVREARQLWKVQVKLTAKTSLRTNFNNLPPNWHAAGGAAIGMDCRSDASKPQAGRRLCVGKSAVASVAGVGN